ncbi:MAG: hypothetical protein U1F17_07955 [Burkholderiaceae bacterium]
MRDRHHHLRRVARLRTRIRAVGGLDTDAERIDLPRSIVRRSTEGGCADAATAAAMSTATMAALRPRQSGGVKSILVRGFAPVPLAPEREGRT